LSSGGHCLACNRIRFVNNHRQPHRRSIAERLRAEVSILHRFVRHKEAITANLELYDNVPVWTLSAMEFACAKGAFVEVNCLCAVPDCERER